MAFSFGNTAAPASGGFSFGSTTSAPSSGGFSFGTTPAAPASSAGGFSFGAAPSTTSTGSGFSFGTAATAPAASTSAFSFGTAAPAAPAAPGGFSFGTTAPAASTGGFSFGSAPTTSASSTSGFSFGSAAPSASTGGFSFGSPAPAATTGGFSFGSTAPATSTGGFSFATGATGAPSATVVPLTVSAPAPYVPISLTQTFSSLSEVQKRQFTALESIVKANTAQSRRTSDLILAIGAERAHRASLAVSLSLDSVQRELARVNFEVSHQLAEARRLMEQTAETTSDANAASTLASRLGSSNVGSARNLDIHCVPSRYHWKIANSLLERILIVQQQVENLEALLSTAKTESPLSEGISASDVKEAIASEYRALLSVGASVACLSESLKKLRAEYAVVVTRKNADVYPHASSHVSTSNLFRHRRDLLSEESETQKHSYFQAGHVRATPMSNEILLAVQQAGAGLTPSTTATAPASTGFGFGSTAPASTGFSFGSTPAAPAPTGFSFGSTAPAPAASASTGFSFGSTTAAPASTGFSFGTAAPAPAAPAAGGFSFGTTAAAPAAGTSGFSFGSTTAAPTAPSTSFSFGTVPATPMPTSGATSAPPVQKRNTKRF